MQLHNTLTGRVEPFTPIARGQVGLYVCGVTPYSDSHIGHAMSAIIYDVLVRYLRWRGETVTFVSNYTDVDDKLIDRARELGEDPLALADRNIAQWEDEQRALGLTFPDVRPRVTQHIPEIIAQIEAIIAREHAYATTSGDVYFRVRSQPDYGKLSHRNIEQLRSGTRFEPGEGKEHPLDFALWKSAKPGEPQWESPWGAGRPGWHIECSAMSQRYLGATFDIHGGGLDLIFPHHENEVAQAEAATGQPFAHIWLHNGLVQRDGEKMSKSLGNVVLVKDALTRWSPDTLRVFVLSSHYRSPANLTDEALTAAARGVERLTLALQRDSGPVTHLTAQVIQYNGEFIAAMDDDLATPRALSVLFGIARDINRLADSGAPVAPLQQTLRELSNVLGLQLARDIAVQLTGIKMRFSPGTVGTQIREADASGLAQLASELGVALTITKPAAAVEALIEARRDARAARDFARADAIRNGLTALGIELSDIPDGTRWSIRG